MLNLMLKIGDDLGLFDAAAQGPASSQELAERAGLQERYVREWLGAMVTGGIFEYDADTCTYTLPPEHAGLLTGIDNVTAFAHRTVLFTKHLAGVTEAFRNGGGVPYTAFRPDFTTFQNLGSRRRHDRFLLSNYLPAVPGLTERLSRGLRACDVGCGTGHAANLMAQAFPASTFVGYDIGQDAIESARQEADESGLNNASFEVQDVRHFPTEPKFDLITAFDAIHDQVDPQGVLNQHPRRPGPRRHVSDARHQGVQQSRGQHRHVRRTGALFGQRDALHDRVAGPRRRRSRHRVG